MKKLLCFLLCAALLCPLCGASEPNTADPAAGLRALAGGGARLLADAERFPAGQSLSDWVALTLALSGQKDDYRAYLRALEKNVTTRYAETGGLDDAAATEWHRISLTVLALGGNPTAFGRRPDGTAIDLIADGTYAYQGGDLGRQGLNAWIFALLTLDAGAYAIPDGARYDRADILEAILSAQNPDGGFGLIPGTSDADMTALALQALAPYAAGEADTVDAALGFLSDAQTAGGGFASFGEENAETAAQALIALCALGLDPLTDLRFLKNGQSILDALERFARADGSFCHTLSDGAGDLMATQQALLALTALQKARAGEGRLYDLTAAAPVQSGPSVWVLLLPVCAAVVIIVVIKRRKHA